jgi:HK97 family phage prohead protease
MQKETFFQKTKLNNQSRTIKGYAALYYDAHNPGSEFPITDDYVVRFSKGAFKLMPSVFAYFSHEKDKVLGKLGKNLSIAFDNRGMAFELSLPDTPTGNEVLALIEAEIIEGCSFGCYPVKTHMAKEGGKDVRWMDEVEVFEVSPTHDPAFVGTEVSLLARDEWIKGEIARLRNFIKECAR